MPKQKRFDATAPDTAWFETLPGSIAIYKRVDGRLSTVMRFRTTSDRALKKADTLVEQIKDGLARRWREDG